MDIELSACPDEFVSEVEAEEPSLDWLPNEVLEKVFCHLPLQQLLSSCSLVNQRWSTIIGRERVGYREYIAVLMDNKVLCHIS